MSEYKANTVFQIRNAFLQNKAFCMCSKELKRYSSREHQESAVALSLKGLTLTGRLFQPSIHTYLVDRCICSTLVQKKTKCCYSDALLTRFFGFLTLLTSNLGKSCDFFSKKGTKTLLCKNKTIFTYVYPKSIYNNIFSMSRVCKIFFLQHFMVAAGFIVLQHKV